MFSDESVELVLYFIAKLITIDKKITCSWYKKQNKQRNYESLNPALACFGYSFFGDRTFDYNQNIQNKTEKSQPYSCPIYILQNYRIPSVPTNPKQTHNGSQTDFTTNAAAP